MGTRCADHVTPLYPQKLALTSPTGGGRSVGIVRSRTKATEFFFFMLLKMSVPDYQWTWCMHPTWLFVCNPRWLWPQYNLTVTTHLHLALKCTTVITTNPSVFVYGCVQQDLDNGLKYVCYSLSHCCYIDHRTLAVSTVPWVLGYCLLFGIIFCKNKWHLTKILEELRNLCQPILIL